MWSAIKIIAEYERAVIFRVGRISGNKAVGPGLFFIIPCTDSFVKVRSSTERLRGDKLSIQVDMRTISFDIPPQEILTKDSVTIRVDAVVYYKIGNAIDSVKNVENASSSTKLLAQVTHWHFQSSFFLKLFSDNFAKYSRNSKPFGSAFWPRSDFFRNAYNPGRSDWSMGNHCRASWSQGRHSPAIPPASHGCWSWGCSRC